MQIEELNEEEKIELTRLNNAHNYAYATYNRHGDSLREYKVKLEKKYFHTDESSGWKSNLGYTDITFQEDFRYIVMS